MECCCYLRSVHDKTTVTRQHPRNAVVRNSTDHQCLSEHWLNYRKRQAKDPSVWTKTMKEICSGYVPRQGGGWSGDLMEEDFEAVHESEAVEICVKRFQNQDVSVKEHYEIPCANGTLRLPRRRRPKRETKQKIRGPLVEMIDITKNRFGSFTTQKMKRPRSHWNTST